MHTVHTLTNQGLAAVPVTIEITATSGIPEIVLIGLANKTIIEAKDRIVTALKSWNVKIKARKIVINLRPADLKKTGSHYDLAIAVGMLNLLHDSQIPTDATAFLGELSLDGTLQPLPDAIRKVQAAKKLGFTQVFIPEQNAQEVTIVSNITIRTVRSLGQLLDAKRLHFLPTVTAKNETFQQLDTAVFDSLQNQEQAKRGVLIAIAGHHHLHLVGPPGLGKTSLAKAAHALLPPLTNTEKIELLSIYEAAQEAKIDHRPLRSPSSHLTVSQLLGSSQRLTPGEASLAHTGILFFDELNQASTNVLQGLRKVLDQKKVVLSNANTSAEFPATVLLLAASNPCPCGYWGTQVRACRCSQSQRANFVKKISGALLDRIDMQLKVSATTNNSKKVIPVTGHQAIEQIRVARDRQHHRFKKSAFVHNSDLTLENYPKYVTLSLSADMLLHRSILRYRLSYRAIEKVISVAQTIADLSQESEISSSHLKEAVSYRFEQYWEESNM